MVILVNTTYLLTADPYSDKSSAILDTINCYFLIVLSIIIPTYSAWNTEPFDRFNYGIFFDILVGLHFIVNIVYVVGQLVV